MVSRFLNGDFVGGEMTAAVNRGIILQMAPILCRTFFLGIISSQQKSAWQKLTKTIKKCKN